MDERHPDWEIAIILSRINSYYLTGTMQDGMLVIPRGDEACLWVRRSYERAVDESSFPKIVPMKSFRDAARTFVHIPPVVYLETEQVPLALYERLHKHFPFRTVKAVDSLIQDLRSVKSPYELGLAGQAGEIHRHVLEDLVPGVLVKGMSEADLTGEIFSLMMKEGHHGIVRFGIFDSDVVLGLIGFGESSIYPTYLDSPGGTAGHSPAVPLIGSRTRKLKSGDLIFVDIGCGVNGYHTDKTMTYVFGRALPDEAVAAHQVCVEIQHTIASLLKPGTKPSEIYETVIAGQDPRFLENFMGFGKKKVQFLGHGIGLEIAENPVIAKGFDKPLEEGMLIAVEPKKGIAGVGMVGIENTFKVTPSGGKSLTGDHPGLLFVGE
ncbi:MAG: Xaa-Pro peptidase family protein [Methanoregulaceae archaeon]|nr:Xaa-Pro peptidase family protein [Methanoregulaceae archaeon]